MMYGALAYQWDHQKEELIDGKVVMMAPAATNHNLISYNLVHLFRNFLRGKKCVPFGDNEKVFLTDKEHYIPDFMVVCDRDIIQSDGVHGTPDLVVEILSPSTGKYDKGHKKRTYEACGVPEYWIISPEARSVDVYLLQGGRYELDGSYSVYPDYLLKNMTEEERAAIPMEFKCHLFDDLVIRLDDVFYDLL